MNSLYSWEGSFLPVIIKLTLIFLLLLCLEVLYKDILKIDVTRLIVTTNRLLLITFSLVAKRVYSHLTVNMLLHLRSYVSACLVYLN